MPIYEIKKTDLTALSDDQLEELVARLAEAEVILNGGKSSAVLHGGALTAPDGGVDVRVCVEDDSFIGDYIPRPHTVFQVKKPKMPAASITREMRSKSSNNLLPVIKELADSKGAYIIVSLADDNAHPEHTKRIDSMRNATNSLSNGNDLYVDFYDRSRLNAWVRRHVSVQLWVRKELKKPLSGWFHFTHWSSTPAGTDDTFIFEKGVEVLVPGIESPLSLEDAIPAVRKLISSTQKATRIAGLSGVGKTRFVQVLFDSSIGSEALDHSSVIYTDVGEEPDPSVRAMVETLIAEDRKATVVVDNCPAELHSILAARLSKETTSISLITIEYDIREESSSTTELIRINAVGPEMAENLIIRRYPLLGGVNSRVIAKMSEGNARLALAIADAVPAGETVAKLTDIELFDRLFNQRHQEQSDLREGAEALSLVYSFSVEAGSDKESKVDELALLGSLCDQSRSKMYRTTAKLLDRDLAQKRGRWRAVLPQAIANRLASDALNNIPKEQLVEVFESQGDFRLMKSFGRRLGYLHDHPVAQSIIKRWLSGDGILSRILVLDGAIAQLLMYVAPVVPETILSMLENELSGSDIQNLGGRHNPKRSNVLQLLKGIAYEPEYFDRAALLLTKIATQEEPISLQEYHISSFLTFFQPYLSGTHASPKQREAVVWRCLNSSRKSEQFLGAKMLETTLKSSPWRSTTQVEFGARPRDFGFHPGPQGLIDWYHRFLNVGKDSSTSDNVELQTIGRQQIANSFRTLWKYSDLHNPLGEAAIELNSQRPWLEGWKAVRSTLYFDGKAKDQKKMSLAAKESLESLEQHLRPKDLASKIRSRVIGIQLDRWMIDDEIDHEADNKYVDTEQQIKEDAYRLGEASAANEEVLEEIGPELFKGTGLYRVDYGRGLLAASFSKQSTWIVLLQQLRKLNTPPFHYGVLKGALEVIYGKNNELANRFLDECLQDKTLRHCLVGLHPTDSFSEGGFERCIKALEYEEMPLQQYSTLIRDDAGHGLEPAQVCQLIGGLLKCSHGPAIVLASIGSMDQPRKDKVLNTPLCRLGLIAAATLMRGKYPPEDQMDDYYLSETLKVCLPHTGTGAEKNDLFDAWVELANKSRGDFYGFEKSLEATALACPYEFLDRLLLGDALSDDIRHSVFHTNTQDKNLLDTLPCQVIIEWCHTTGRADVWGLVAAAIDPYSGNTTSRGSTLSDLALMLIDASPKPAKVVEAYIEQLSPAYYVGDSLADIIASRRYALEVLQDHQNEEVRVLLAEGMRVVLQKEGRIRQKEHKRDEELERTFE